MGQTQLDIRGDRFLINGALTCSEIPGSIPAARGLLMNARFIQGIFDDRAAPARFARFGQDRWDPAANTERLVAALPQWHAHGLRAITVGFQGGGPVFTTDNSTIDNNPFGEDGRSLDPAYAARMDRLIRGAGAAGMVIIVSFLYGSQSMRLRDGAAIRSAVTTASRFLRDGRYGNVIIEVANEHNVEPFKHHPIVFYAEGMAALIDLARRESGGLPVGCSSYGGWVDREIVQASDVALIHGNGCTRQRFAQLVRKTRGFAPGKPVVCNEDSQMIGQLLVAFREGCSWGYYNNLTKQEPPADWAIMEGEDRFFAIRMAQGLGIDVKLPPPQEQVVLQLDPRLKLDGQAWPRLAALYPESIDFVEFFLDDELLDTVYDEPFMLFWQNTWMQKAWALPSGERLLRAVVHLRNGQIMERSRAVNAS